MWLTGLAVRVLLRCPVSTLSFEPAYMSTIEKLDSLYTRSSSLGSVTTITGTAGFARRGERAKSVFSFLRWPGPRMEGAVGPGFVGDVIPSDMAAKSRSCLLLTYG